MELLLSFITLHIIADFYLQPSTWVTDRNQHRIHSRALLKHVSVHFVLNMLLLAFLKYSSLQILIVVCSISISHYLIDLWKSYQPQTHFFFFLDQLLHLLVILLCWLYLYDNALEVIRKAAMQIYSVNGLVVIVCFLIACKPASVICINVTRLKNLC